MKIFFRSDVLILILILFITINNRTDAVELSLDIISPSTTLLQLNHWQITKDNFPKEPLSEYPDSVWKTVDISLDVDNYAEGNWIIKTTIFIKDLMSENEVLGLFPLDFISAYDIYWDGNIIAHNGERGVDSESEKAGLYRFKVILPHRITTPGEHTIIMRISNHQNYRAWNWLSGTFLIGKYDYIQNAEFKSSYQAFFISGILLVAFLFNLFLYISRERKAEHLLFSLFCLSVILDYLTIQAVLFFDLPTTYIHFEYYFYKVNTLLFTLLFTVFLIFTFSLPRKTIFFIVAVILIIYLFFTDNMNMFKVFSLTVLVLGTILSVWSLILKREGSVVIFIGLILSWVSYFSNFAFAGLSTIMVICSSFSIAHKFALSERAEKEAQLKSARLEVELLKKNINPHFILNTLTSIIVWLRKDTNSAIKLIEALAEEFRIINQVSAIKLIPVDQEIALCKAHLKIMSYRKGAEYQLETIDVDGKELIPPMIFHTLVENGLTHGFENKTEGLFTLRRIKNFDSIQYILNNDGEFNPEDQKGSSGFGIRYITSRLEESFHGRWKIDSHKTETGWETIIEIRDK